MNRETFGLKTNPFISNKIVTENEYFESMHVHRDLEKKIGMHLEWDMIPTPLRYIITGGQGSGKTSCLMHIKHMIEKKRNDSLCIYHDQGVLDVHEILEKSQLYAGHFNDPPFKELERISNKKNIFILWDCPPHEECEPLLKDNSVIIDRILKINNIHLFFTMDSNTYKTLFKIHPVVRNFEKVELNTFTLNMTREMLENRMAHYREDNRYYCGIQPFDDEIIPLVHEKGKKNPSCILKMACELLEYARSNNISRITKSNIPTDLLNEKPEKIIYNHVNNTKKADLLYLLLNEIENEFNGLVEKQAHITRHMNEKYGWAKNTTIKRLKELNKIQVIEVTTADDLWTKQYKLK